MKELLAYALAAAAVWPIAAAISRWWRRRQERKRLADVAATAEAAEQRAAAERHRHEQEAIRDEASREHGRVDGLDDGGLLDDARARLGQRPDGGGRAGLFNPPGRRPNRSGR